MWKKFKDKMPKPEVSILIRNPELPGEYYGELYYESECDELNNEIYDVPGIGVRTLTGMMVCDTYDEDYEWRYEAGTFEAGDTVLYDPGWGDRRHVGRVVDIGIDSVYVLDAKRNVLLLDPGKLELVSVYLPRRKK